MSRKTLARWLAVLAVAVSCRARTTHAPPANPTRTGGGKTFEHALYQVTLPPGWEVAEFAPEGGRPRYVETPGREFDASGSAGFADLAGDWFAIEVDPARDFEADAIWNVRVGEDGVSVRVVSEGAMCVPTGRGDVPAADEACSAGNGSLEIGTLPSLDIHGHWFWFYFGNTDRETGLDLEPFRGILRSFRAR